MDAGNKKVVYAAMIGNGLIAISKFVASFLTGSTAMLSEAVHSTADTVNQTLLVYGMKRAARPPTALHPLGYGPESYFWPFVVSLVIFALGGVFALYEGIHGFLVTEHEVSGHSQLVNYVVLGMAIVFEAVVFMVAIKEFNSKRGTVPFLKQFLRAKDPTVPVVLMEDAAALAGLLVALAAVLLTEFTGWFGWDALGSILIGVILCVVALLLAFETHSLLLGESVSIENRQKILDTVEKDPAVERVTQVITVHRSADDVLVALKVQFRNDLDIGKLEDIIDRVEDAVRAELPIVGPIFVEPDSKYDGKKDPDYHEPEPLTPPSE